MLNVKLLLDFKLIEKSLATAMLGTCAIASTLQNKPVLAFFGAFGCGLGYVRVKGRIREIITERDRAARKVSLQAFFNSCGVTPTEAEINACLDGMENQHAIVYRYQQVRDGVQSTNSSFFKTSCCFYNNDAYLHCAVNPEDGCQDCRHYREKS